MTIRMLQAWNGLPQQTVTTLTSAEEGRLVGLGLASFDIDGPSDNSQLARLNTDSGYVPPVNNQVSLVPGNVYAGYSFNFAVWNMQPSQIYNGAQYAVWVGFDSSSRMVPYIGKRSYPDGQWSSQSLYQVVGGTTFGTQTGDAHNNMTVAVSIDGIIHVIGNQHTNGLLYIKSTNPEDITAWSAATMIGTQESSVTYPTLFFIGTQLYFFYRDGSSGNGDWYLNKYTPGSGWSRVVSGPIFEGKTTGPQSLYPNRLAIGRDGSIHVIGTWRMTGAVNNQDICYAVSYDGGVTWKKSNGTQYTLPITHATMEVVESVAAQPAATDFINQCGADIGPDGTLHAVFLRKNSGGYVNIQYHRKVGSTWTSQWLTNWTAATMAYCGRPAVIAVDGRVLVVYREDKTQRGAVWAYDVTDPTKPVRFKLVDIDLRDWEPCYSQTSLRERNQLDLNIGQCIQDQSTPPTGELFIGHPWFRQWLGVASYDLSKFSEIVAGKGRIPRIATLARSSYVPAAEFTTASTSNVAVGAGVHNLIGPEWRGKKLLHRVRAAFRNTGGGARIAFQEKVTGGTSVTIDALAQDATIGNTPLIQWTPYITMQLFPDASDATGYLFWYFRAVTAGTAGLLQFEHEIAEVVF